MTGLYSIVGTPSPTLYATLNLLRTLIQAAFGDHHVVAVNSPEALRKEFPSPEARAGRPVILFSDYPEPALMETLRGLEAPLAICLDDFATIAHYAVVSRDYAGVQATRFATMGLVNLETAAVDPPPLSLTVRDRNTSVSALVHGLAWLYHLPIDGEVVGRVLAACGLADRTGATLGDYAARTLLAYDNARALLERRSPLENELIDFVARQYDGIARGQRLEKLEWPVFALLRPEFPERLTIGPIDLTGPARFIYHGPYFALPAGAWRAELVLEVSDCFARDPVQIDVTAPEIIAAVRAELPSRGVHGCQIRFEIEDPTRHVEIRLQLLTGAIEGVIQLRRIVLHRLGSLDADEENRL